ncbi:MAG: hypothetical protein RR992_06890 [Clostridiales bacterium]
MTARTRFISCNTGFKEAHGVLLGAWLNDNNHGVNAPDIIREVSAKIDDYHLTQGVVYLPWDYTMVATLLTIFRIKPKN